MTDLSLVPEIANYKRISFENLVEKNFIRRKHKSMSKRIAIAGALFIFLTTVTVKKEIEIFYFNLKEISVENNFLISTQEIQNLLSPIYEKNLILLSRKEIEKELMKNSLIESYKIKKKYPNSLNIKIF